MTLFLLIAFFGACGAAARYRVNEIISNRFKTSFPLGTFVVNISGCMLAGIIFGLSLSITGYEELLFAGLVGFTGSYTTFSTWMVQSVGQLSAKAWLSLFFNLLGSLIIGVIAAFLALKITLFILG